MNVPDGKVSFGRRRDQHSEFSYMILIAMRSRLPYDRRVCISLTLCYVSI